MELDDFKSAWQSLDQRLARDHRLQAELYRERRLDKTRASLRPLFWGQIAQMVLGVGFIALATLLWRTHPSAAATIVAGVVVHAYGVACIVAAGQVLGGLGRIDYAAPVLAIQTQLARVRRSYVLSGMVAGLPWWFLWLPILMVLVGLRGVDMAERAPSLIVIGVAVGVVGLLGTAVFHRWSRSARRPGLAQKMEDAVTGASLRKAQSQLEELRRFGEE